MTKSAHAPPDDTVFLMRYPCPDGYSPVNLSILSAAFILFECIVSLGGGYRALRRFGLAVTVNACASTPRPGDFTGEAWNGIMECQYGGPGERREAQ